MESNCFLIQRIARISLPSDNYLFRAMTHFLSGRRFKDRNDVEMGYGEFFVSKSKDWYLNGIKQWAERWVRTIEHNGLYFEE